MPGERIKISKLESEKFSAENLDLTIGEIVDETADWEPIGPTPIPGLTDLRDWDFKLMERYRPQYYPACDQCCFCAFGVCDLSDGKEGACGLRLHDQVARKNFMRATWGVSAHTAHARDVVEDAIEKFGPDVSLDMGDFVDVEAPNIRLVAGMKPETLADLRGVLDYLEEEIVQMTDSLHTGQEGDNTDFESKALNAGMLDHVGMETADIAQIAAYDMPKGDPEAPLADIGMGTIDKEKPNVLVYGHNVMGAEDVMRYTEENGLWDEVEISGLCCTVIDMTRIDQRPKIVGSLASAIKFIRSGIADVVVTDEQCVRADTYREAKAVGSKVIATSTKICYGLPNRSDDPPDEIVEDMVENGQDGVLITDLEKVGEVAVRVAQGIYDRRKDKKAAPTQGEIEEILDKCVLCGSCDRSCPNDLPIKDSMKDAKEGNFEKLADLFSNHCIGCGRCGEACPNDVQIMKVMEKASEKKVKEEKHKIRVGRGPIRDTEIRDVGAPIVLGKIPGVVGMVGCSNYPDAPGGFREPIYRLAKELAERNYIITLTGCHAMDVAFFENEDRESIYEEFPGVFDAGGVVNCGSCVSNPHISGAAMKIANIYARMGLRGNYKEVADYILNRVGAVGVSWGAMSQKAVSIANGFQRLGIPVILGPRSSLYGRSQMGRRDKPELWKARNKRKTDEGEYIIGPGPEHLVYYAESAEELLVKSAKLCIRPADTDAGRQIKLTHYIDLYSKYFDEKYPPDLHMFVRREQDVPIKYRTEVMKMLKDDPRWEKEKYGGDQPTILDKKEIKEGLGKVV
ncbi:hypothetical protein AKJ63_00795 [candidate division MSBL1 archaeon SCGC-AAA259D18]|uniref:4Fe-4S ferredoxin-type domain-containing protein n=2 Tax=candidate division MSBL1 TaxID=215777 RepID=A0A133U9R6_9EURY|nr:hypothetical protein AKJ57_02970 [candidate division MSBL1 archaeon SCGC-AAA259A05]KXA91819.1 hypothetical protein AKJ63_00795 [candidate division MSBL1 archaeon SCGC-AAA259D18]